MPRATKTRPLSIRLPAEDLSIIDRAAILRGRSRSDFVREAAMKAAEEVIIESALVRMTGRGFAAFADVLAKPAIEVGALVEILKRKAPWER